MSCPTLANTSMRRPHKGLDKHGLWPPNWRLTHWGSCPPRRYQATPQTMMPAATRVTVGSPKNAHDNVARRFIAVLFRGVSRQGRALAKEAVRPPVFWMGKAGLQIVSLASSVCSGSMLRRKGDGDGWGRQRQPEQRCPPGGATTGAA